MTFETPRTPEKPKLPAVIKAGMVLRGTAVGGDVHEIKPPPPVYPEGYIPPEEAHRQAQQILAEAAESARRLQEQARQQGYEEGHNAGYQEGFQKAQQAVIDSWTGLLGAFRQQIEGLLAQRQAILAAAEPDVIRLVLMAASKVIQRECREPDFAAELIARTLPRASDGTIVRIRVSPADYARLQGVPLAPPGMAAFELVADPGVGSGGCLIECHLCTIDATFRTLFEEVARELMRDEPETDPAVSRALAELAQPAYPVVAPAGHQSLSATVPQAPPADSQTPGTAGIPAPQPGNPAPQPGIPDPHSGVPERMPGSHVLETGNQGDAGMVRVPAPGTAGATEPPDDDFDLPGFTGV